MPLCSTIIIIDTLYATLYIGEKRGSYYVFLTYLRHGYILNLFYYKDRAVIIGTPFCIAITTLIQFVKEVFVIFIRVREPNGQTSVT